MDRPSGYPSAPTNAAPRPATYQPSNPSLPPASHPPVPNHYPPYNPNNAYPAPLHPDYNNMQQHPSAPPPPSADPSHNNGYAPYGSSPYGPPPGQQPYLPPGSQNEYVPLPPPPMNQGPEPSAPYLPPSAPPQQQYQQGYAQGETPPHGSQQYGGVHPHSGVPYDQTQHPTYGSAPPPPSHGMPNDGGPYGAHGHGHGHGQGMDGGKQKMSLQDKLMQKVNDPQVQAMAGKILGGKKPTGSGESGPPGYPSSGAPSGYPSAGPPSGYSNAAPSGYPNAPPPSGYHDGGSSGYHAAAGGEQPPKKQSLQDKVMEKMSDPKMQEMAGKVLKNPMAKKVLGKIVKTGL